MVEMKKILSILLFFILPALPTFAAASADVALADAETVWRAVAEVEKSMVPQEFETAFGKPVEMQNMGANVYRNLDWHIPLASADVSLDLHVGFNYGRKAEWSMSIDFDDDADTGRRYFVALCRGFERITGHVSRVVRIEPMRADTSVTAHYPLPSGLLLAVSSSDDDSFGTIFMTSVALGAERVFTLRILGDDVPMYERPLEKSNVVRRLRKGYKIVSLETRTSADPKYLWHKVRDGDGEPGWVYGKDATPVGIFDLDHAFDKMN
ncbi:hypothetical protein LJC31_07575 [Synergistaceae bacterium OttesenSCG-928-I11]|nr:hypothetical protein [Synergistaceae bacterium OttesenSCG-928-I11]